MSIQICPLTSPCTCIDALLHEYVSFVLWGGVERRQLELKGAEGGD
jgi:hypothetical protein